jgi:hypothetical protein
MRHIFLRGLDKDTPERTCRIILSPFDDGIGHGQKPVYGNFPYTPLLLMNTSLADTLNENSISDMLISIQRVRLTLTDLAVSNILPLKWSYNHNKDCNTASSTFDS